MNWKQLLKPDWRKNITFFILIFLVLYNFVICNNFDLMFKGFDVIDLSFIIIEPFYKTLIIFYYF